MARRKQQPIADAPEIPSSPQWGTRVRRVLSDGRLQGIDNSLWLYGRVPMTSIRNAKDARKAHAAGDALLATFRDLADLASKRGSRETSKSTYREVHLFWMNIPVWFKAPSGIATEAMLNREYADRTTMHKALMIGVRLKPSVGFDWWKPTQLAQWIEETLEGDVDALLKDYDRDTDVIRGIFERNGIGAPSTELLRMGQSWWNHGQPRSVPVLPHEEHLHFFTRMATKRDVEAHHSLKDCDDWPEQGQYPITWANVQDFNFGLDRHTGDPDTLIVPELADSGARVVSIRALVEPAELTLVRLKRQRRAWRGDALEFDAINKDRPGDLEDRVGQLEALTNLYERGRRTIPPTLIDLSMIVGFDGAIENVDAVAPGLLRMTPMTNAQPAAWQETQLCSGVRANPVPHELPATGISHIGLQDIDIVGDRTGALAGFSEDGQAVYIAASAATMVDSYPYMGIFSATGSGKTVLLQWLFYQWALLGHPCAYIDPKTESHLDAIVEMVRRHRGDAFGRIVSFDSLVNQEGLLDPLRTSKSPADGIGLAVSMISSIDERFRAAELELLDAIKYGISRGATGTGEALTQAYLADKISQDLVDPLFKVASNLPAFQACFATDPSIDSLRVAEGMTLFKAGASHFQTPIAGLAWEKQPMAVKASVNLVRMVVRGTMNAMMGRAPTPVVGLDEGHLISQSAPGELNEVGRLMRQWGMLPVYVDQTPSGPLQAGLKGYFSRGFVGHIKDESEAQAALDMFKIDNPRALERIQVEPRISGGGGLNYESLAPLWLDTPEGRVFKRSSIFYHRDIDDNFTPVEIDLPGDFMRVASSNAEDIRQREAEAAAAS